MTYVKYIDVLIVLDMRQRLANFKSSSDQLGNSFLFVEEQKAGALKKYLKSLNVQNKYVLWWAIRGLKRSIQVRTTL